VTTPDVGADTDSPPEKEETKKTKKDGPGRALSETVLLLGFAILLALVVKTFFIQSFYIPSESMEPGLVVDDRILVQKPSYWNGEPQRGDVIVFDDPGGWLNGLQNPQPQSLLARGLAKIGLYPTGGHLVKRVIGVEGDVIVCCDEEGRLSVNGQPIDESAYLSEQPPKKKPCNGPMIRNCEWTAGPVPKDSLFVMGDNRANSADSSVHICRKRVDCDPQEGYVSIDLVVGKVFALAWPPGRAEFIGRADAFEDVPDPETD
jgi:signal peptidase I